MTPIDRFLHVWPEKSDKSLAGLMNGTKKTAASRGGRLRRGSNYRGFFWYLVSALFLWACALPLFACLFSCLKKGRIKARIGNDELTRKSLQKTL